MDLQTLGVIFNCCVVGGFVVPVVNVAVGALGGALHLGGGVDTDLDIDVDVGPDIDVDTDLAAQSPGHTHGAIPVNLMTLSLTAVVFGAVGRLCLTVNFPTLPGILLAAFCGVAAGALLGRFVVLPLKRSRSYATNVHRLRGAEAVVQLEIRDDFEGKIFLPGATGSIITYGARPAPGFQKLTIGQKVIIVGVDVEREVCVVQPLCEEEENT